MSITNCHINGESTYSATCDGHHYWNLYFTGSDDQVTLKNNYIHHFSGRAPKLGGNTLLHAVNNYVSSKHPFPTARYVFKLTAFKWYDSNGHGFEVLDQAYVLAEGNVFGDVTTVYESGDATTLYTVNDATGEAACSDYLGRACVSNSFSNSGTFSFSDSSVLSQFNSVDSIASADDVSTVTGLSSSAGYGTI